MTSTLFAPVPPRRLPAAGSSLITRFGQAVDVRNGVKIQRAPTNLARQASRNRHGSIDAITPIRHIGTSVDITA